MRLYKIDITWQAIQKQFIIYTNSFIPEQVTGLPNVKVHEQSPANKTLTSAPLIFNFNLKTV